MTFYGALRARFRRAGQRGPLIPLTRDPPDAGAGPLSKRLPLGMMRSGESSMLERPSLALSCVCLAATLSTACGADREEEDDSLSTSVSLSTTTTVSTTAPATEGDDTMGSDTIGKLDVGGPSTADGSTGLDECESIDEVAGIGLQPADIIVVIDNSGSMDFEANQVQVNMNAFSSQIFLANIDAHVVVISSYPDSTGVCIDPPLGSGGCPLTDNNPPLFTHINDGVDSNNALQKLIEHHPDWAPVMRGTASKHVIIVTDDESDLSAADFQTMWAALDPAYVPYKLHAIAATADPIFACLQQPPHQCCAISAAPGNVYMNLAGATGGVFGDLCLQEFQPIFDAVATQVIEGSALACEYTIPPAPNGEDFDPGQVNVEFFDGANASLLELGKVDDAAACAGVADGWYYDDAAAPTTILLCPQTCESVQGFPPMSRVSIQFGCATVPAG